MRHHHLLFTGLVACATQTPPAVVAHTLCPKVVSFDHAVCACEDLDYVGSVRVLAGPAGAGSLGVNGATNLVSSAEISGSLDAYGGLSSVGASIGNALATSGDVDVTGDLRVSGDAALGGNLDAVGDVAIGGTLGLAGDVSILGSGTIAGRGAYAAPARPCGCDPATLFDVAGAVAMAKATASGQRSWDAVGDRELHLATGNYYVTSADIVGMTTIVIDGKASVYVDGSLETVGATQWKLGPEGELDLFVSGTLASVGDLVAGDPTRANRFRLYLGGDPGDLEIVGNGEFFGTIYAPTATISHVGDLHVVGSLFARTLDGVGSLTVEYGTPLSAPTSCSSDQFQ